MPHQGSTNVRQQDRDCFCRGKLEDGGATVRSGTGVGVILWCLIPSYADEDGARRSTVHEHIRLCRGNPDQDAVRTLTISTGLHQSGDVFIFVNVHGRFDELAADEVSFEVYLRAPLHWLLRLGSPAGHFVVTVVPGQESEAG